MLRRNLSDSDVPPDVPRCSRREGCRLLGGGGAQPHLDSCRFPAYISGLNSYAVSSAVACESGRWSPSASVIDGRCGSRWRAKAASTPSACWARAPGKRWPVSTIPPFDPIVSPLPRRPPMILDLNRRGVRSRSCPSEPPVDRAPRLAFSRLSLRSDQPIDVPHRKHRGGKTSRPGAATGCCESRARSKTGRLAASSAFIPGLLEPEKWGRAALLAR